MILVNFLMNKNSKHSVLVRWVLKWELKDIVNDERFILFVSFFVVVVSMLFMFRLWTHFLSGFITFLEKKTRKILSIPLWFFVCCCDDNSFLYISLIWLYLFVIHFLMHFKLKESIVIKQDGHEEKKRFWLIHIWFYYSIIIREISFCTVAQA